MADKNFDKHILGQFKCMLYAARDDLKDEYDIEDTYYDPKKDTLKTLQNTKKKGNAYTIIDNSLKIFQMIGESINETLLLTSFEDAGDLNSIDELGKLIETQHYESILAWILKASNINFEAEKELAKLTDKSHVLGGMFVSRKCEIFKNRAMTNDITEAFEKFMKLVAYNVAYTHRFIATQSTSITINSRLIGLGISLLNPPADMKHIITTMINEENNAKKEKKKTTTTTAPKASSKKSTGTKKIIEEEKNEEQLEHSDSDSSSE